MNQVENFIRPVEGKARTRIDCMGLSALSANAHLAQSSGLKSTDKYEISLVLLIAGWSVAGELSFVDSCLRFVGHRCQSAFMRKTSQAHRPRCAPLAS
jgi:hypothetical protein